MSWWNHSTEEARAEAEGYHCGKHCCGSINFPDSSPRPNQEHFDKGYARAVAERQSQ